MKKTTGFKKKKGRIRSKKPNVDGIQFASNLEVYMYRELKKMKVPFTYEGQTYVIVEGFHFPNTSFEKTAAKKFLHDVGNKNILPIKYTPDFVAKEYPPRFIIECKGHPNDAFPLRWKLFKRFLVRNNINATLFMPRNKKDCEETARLLKEML